MEEVGSAIYFNNNILENMVKSSVNLFKFSEKI